MDSDLHLSRRELLRLSALTAATATLAACSRQTANEDVTPTGAATPLAAGGATIVDTTTRAQQHRHADD